MNDYLSVLKKYAVFSGRASRKEFWMFTLISTIITIILEVVAVPVHALIALAIIYMLGTLVPSLAVMVRRLHDTNKSGWMILLGLIPLAGGIIMLVFAVMDSQP